MKVRQATVNDLTPLSQLFDGYRQFYEQPSDPDAAKAFLLERFSNNQSVIFMAEDDTGAAVGFTQLYPSFSSVSMARLLILNDLFVSNSCRRQGAASALLRAAESYGKSIGAILLGLSTAHDNQKAQALYVAEGWEKETEFCNFSKAL